MVQFKRKKLFVDAEVQRSLIARVVAYWLACMATLELLLLTWTIASGPEQPTFTAYFTDYDWRAVGARMLIAVIVLVPVVWDVLSFSNRFAGPVFRVRRILREIARSGSIEHVRFRQGDYWHGLADDLNAAFERLAASASGAESSAVEAEHAARMNSADAYSPAP